MDQVSFSSNQFASPAIQMVDPAGGLSLWMMGMLVTLKAVKAETGGSYSLFEDIVPAGAGPPAHTHTQEDETWYMIDGEMEWTVGGKLFKATKGCFIHLPRFVPHGFANKSDKPAHMLLTYAPAGFERWFTELGTPIADRNAPGEPPPPTPELMQKAMKLGEELGVNFHGGGKATHSEL